MDKCETCFSAKAYLEPWQSKTIVELNTAIIVTTLITNIAVIISIVKTKQLNNASNLIICLLSISDCTIACVAQPFISITFLKQQFTCSFEIATQFFTSSFGHLSGCCIVAIAVDRMMHMRYLNTYAQILTRKRIFLICLGCILMAFMVGLSYTFASINAVYEIVNTIILVLDCFLIMLISLAYLNVYRKINRHVKNTENIRTMNRTINSKGNGRKKTEYVMSMVKVIARILISVWIAYFPYTITSLLWDYRTSVFTMGIKDHLSFILYLTHMLVYLNSTMNAVIFLSGNESSRAFIMMKFHRDYSNSSVEAT